MFERVLNTAFESGGDVLVQLNAERYKGRVLDLNDEYFTLFHSGTGGGVLWAFRLADIAYCGLVVELPSEVARLSRAVSCPHETTWEETPDDDDPLMTS